MPNRLPNKNQIEYLVDYFRLLNESELEGNRYVAALVRKVTETVRAFCYQNKHSQSYT